MSETLKGKEDILSFIGKYSECRYEFLNGWCYAFATMLAKYFHGEVYYLPVLGHFVCLVDGSFYDVRGKLDKDKIGEHPYRWKDYKRLDRLETSRIIRDCIMKE